MVHGPAAELALRDRFDSGNARVEVPRIEPDALVQLVHRLVFALEHLHVVARVLEQGAADAQRGVALARGGQDALHGLLIGRRRGKADVEQAGQCFHELTARARPANPVRAVP